MRLSNYASSKLVYGYDSENDDDYYLYHGAFALGGDTEEDFARHHWMIDSGCTDHLSPFLDDFAHLGNMVRHAVIANGQKVPIYGPGKIILNQRIKGSEQKYGTLHMPVTDFCWYQHLLAKAISV